MALIKVSNNALQNITAVPASIPTGSLTLIKSITASSSASIEFINGTSGVVLDGTYNSYIFSFTDIHPSNDNTSFQFNLSTDNGSNYNVIKTTTYFQAYQSESGASSLLEYDVANDLAQSTAYQTITPQIGNDADQSCAGTLTLYNPSSTTYVKHFISTSNGNLYVNYTFNIFMAGYGNTTSAVNAIQFKYSSGNIDDGTIKLYGVK